MEKAPQTVLPLTLWIHLIRIEMQVELADTSVLETAAHVTRSSTSEYASLARASRTPTVERAAYASAFCR